MSAPLVSVVIVTQNRVSDVLECLASVEQSLYEPIEIIVVDNASTDGTVNSVSHIHPNIRVCALLKNVGLTGGRNAGQACANGFYVLFLDSDTTIEPTMIGELVKFCVGSVGITCPKMYSYTDPNRIWYAGATFNLLTSRANNIGDLEVDVGQYDVVRTTSHGPTCFLVRKEIAELLGGHNQEFVMSYGDADFALRAWESGYEALYVPTAKLHHKMPPFEMRNSLRMLGFASPTRAYYYSRNKVIFMKRHAKFLNFLAFLFLFFPLIDLGYTVEIIRRRGEFLYIRMFWSGVADALLWLARESIGSSSSSAKQQTEYLPKTKIGGIFVPPR